MNSMAGSRGPTGGMRDKVPSGYRTGQLHQFTPEQDKLFAQQFGHVSPESYLGRLAGGDQSMFEQMEAPAMRQFAGLQGQLSSRFSGMGMGARNSSGFQNTMTAAGSNFAQDLAARRQELQQQAIRDLMGMSNQLLGQRPDERFLVQKQQKQGTNWGGLAGGALGGVAGFFGSGGNPMGAMAGAGLGYNVGSGLSGSQSQVSTPNFYGSSGGWGNSHQGPHYNFPSP